ncbi:hypothetical protein N7G274_003949 [Stereocaulon virgatum]|uniref:Uncharacterized protein n=1 Tax=Stereocaulon virgatum TaxID=373712 RepID=A0ABR4ACU2_9LECA
MSLKPCNWATRRLRHFGARQNGGGLFTRILDEGSRRSSEQRRNATWVASSQVSEGTAAASAPAKTSLPRLWPYPGARKVLDRPYANISGRRHVPKLVNANRVPFLRFKKPQSPFLSRIIRDTIKTREARYLLAARLQDLLAHANDEDLWDWTLAEYAGISRSDSEQAWSSEIHQALAELASLQAKARNKRVSMATQMQAIVEKEKALAMEDRARKWREKYMARMARRARYFAGVEQHVPLTEEQRILKGVAATEELSLPERTIAKAVLEEETGVDQKETQPFPWTVEDRSIRNERREEQVIEKVATPKSDDGKVDIGQSELDNEVSVASRGSDIPLPFEEQQDDSERLQVIPGRQYQLLTPPIT